MYFLAVRMEKFVFEEKQGKKSGVWCYFLREKKGQLGKCKQCHAVIKTQGGSTSGLRTHMKTRHNQNIGVSDIVSVSATSGNLANSSHKITKYFKEDVDSLPACLARMVAKDGLPFIVFTTSNDLRQGLTARGFTKIPTSANTIKKLVLDYSHQVRVNMIRDFESRIRLGERFSLTFDEWTSIRNRRYININVHIYKKFWNIGLSQSAWLSPSK